MKAITIWQPWATLIAYGIKEYETRSWATKYRGPIAIHSAQKSFCECWSKFTTDETKTVIQRRLNLLPLHDHDEFFPTGRVIATAELVDIWKVVCCSETEAEVVKCGAGERERLIITGDEKATGDWTPGRYVWKLENINPLTPPVIARGFQGLWNWEN